MFLDKFGRTITTYFWYDVEDGDDVYYGWFDEDFNLAEGVTVQPGEGLYFSAPSADYVIKSAGEVPTQNITVQLRSGAKHVVNPTPVAIDINDEDNGVIITGYNPDDGSEEEVSSMTLDKFGRTISTYFWYDVVDGDDVFYGWFDEDFNPVEGVTMQPGESLYFVAPSTDYYVNFKGIVIQ